MELLILFGPLFPVVFIAIWAIDKWAKPTDQPIILFGVGVWLPFISIAISVGLFWLTGTNALGGKW